MNRYAEVLKEHFTKLLTPLGISVRCNEEAAIHGTVFNFKIKFGERVFGWSWAISEIEIGRWLEGDADCKLRERARIQCEYMIRGLFAVLEGE